MLQVATLKQTERHSEVLFLTFDEILMNNTIGVKKNGSKSNVILFASFARDNLTQVTLKLSKEMNSFTFLSVTTFQIRLGFKLLFLF